MKIKDFWSFYKLYSSADKVFVFFKIETCTYVYCGNGVFELQIDNDALEALK